jgi:polyribonucleotide nucleotidyltransferase
MDEASILTAERAITTHVNPEDGSVRVSTVIGGRTYELESGLYARQADAAVMVRYGDTMVLVTVCAAEEPSPTVDFLPLSVDYREKSSAAGKIPGSFFRREGRPTDKEVLSARLIDRPCRPLFPKTWRYETQIIATVFSYDQEIDGDTLGATGASAALMISDIPFAGPISEVRVGRVDGEFRINPTFSELERSDMDLVVAGSDSSIVMVEGSAKEISEADFLQALEFAHGYIRQLNALQRRLQELLGRPKREIPPDPTPEELRLLLQQWASEEIRSFIRQQTTKEQRSQWRKALRERMLEQLQPILAEQHPEWAQLPLQSLVAAMLTELERAELRRMILTEGRRLDGRTPQQIRPILCRVGVLPRTHGSAFFMRGETQSLATVTLGTKGDEQIIDGLLPTYTRRFMFHYTFPPYSTGEIRRPGPPSRREIGHGNLAERALECLIPPEEEFPYTIRVVSDILESNGSSSMASVCAGSLALFDAGVPLRKAAAGIAMGLIKEGDQVAILSDILGDEDHLGDMDFKVAGTADGITACQMDIKIEGISLELMAQALEQARQGRLYILDIMNQTLPQPRPQLSPYAPRLTLLTIPVETIGLVIGPGGETIRRIVQETGAEINIEQDGKVIVAARSEEALQKAVEYIQSLTQMPELGQVYTGVVREIREGLGAIVEFLPRRLGLLHISQIDYRPFNTISEVLKVGDVIDVKLIEIQPDGKFRLSRKALLPAPAQKEQGHRGAPEHGSARREATAGPRPSGRPQNHHRRSGPPPRRHGER